MPQTTTSPPAPILLLDGGLGTTLEDIHHTQPDSTFGLLWSSQLLITSPTTLLTAQTSFANAGADIILTATYQASHAGFQHGVSPIPDRDAELYMRSAVQIAKSAFRNREPEAAAARGRAPGRVALSLGAYGATMVPSQEYSGKYDSEHDSVELLRLWHLRRLNVFARDDGTWRDVDLVAFETIPRVDEVYAVREAVCAARMSAAENWRPRPFWISCVFPGEGNILPDGTEVEVLVRAMLGQRDGADVPFAVGLNCTRIGKIEGLVRKFERAVEALLAAGEVDEWPSLVVYPDGTRGEVYNTTTRVWESKSDTGDTVPWNEVMLGITEQARNSGRWKSVLVGGCCKTTPDDIAKLRSGIDLMQR